jgi:mannose-1-phosphate guanylyltransferase
MGRIFTWNNSVYHRDIGTIASWTEAHRDFPGTPANAHNAAVWLGIMQSVDENLSRSMAQLLAGDVSQGPA